MTQVPLRPSVAALPPYVPGARTQVGAAAFKLSSNENPFPPLASVVSAIADGAMDVNRYPDMHATELAEAIGAHLGVNPAGVVTGNGSVAVLAHVLAAVCDAGDEVVFPWRSFEAYPIAAGVAGAHGVRVPLTADSRLDLPAMAAAVTDRTRVLLLCTPNNPTGPAVRADELAQLLAVVPRNVLVILDEAYVEFVRDPQAADGLAVFAQHPNVVLLRTFSKAYGLAGLRVGYAVARPRLAAGIRAVSTPFGVSHLAQLAALASLRAADELMIRVQAVVDERSRMLAGLRGQGWRVPESEGNFVWLPLGDRAVAFAEQSARAGVLVRPFAGDGVRVSVGEREATDLLLEVAQAFTR
ncbi:histidinol-phosphate transaminase [Cellulomonas chengniuliangii]|uniref:Aromatic amino acid aminotransferase n=1 Tax=Cellulomonas chengniuliangii TaxID=2968084 RepID=A0ABY5KXH4_9CELL|nr:histidinol-phosphate transaminase [Cellulomonas chengniuliangii]MCC2309228.1 histidinol-phosphate transaminase [Cellulomonas chengniuliangii]MCC2318572.1 histidinol-phosphate transaminase [Cellulomonas chengniuliangii]UUI75197.1 histidinol-phosphate transaminase [Cellulomonas chengniuliangii]